MKKAYLKIKLGLRKRIFSSFFFWIFVIALGSTLLSIWLLINYPKAVAVQWLFKLSYMFLWFAVIYSVTMGLFRIIKYIFKVFNIKLPKFTLIIQKINFNINYNLLIIILVSIHAVIFIMGILNFRDYKIYFDYYGYKSPLFSIIPHYDECDIYFVFGIELVLLTLNFFAIVGLMAKKAWGWYSSFVFMLARGFNSVLAVFIFKDYFIKNESFNWSALVIFITSSVVILMLFDRSLQSIIKLKSGNELIKWLFFISFLICLFYVMTANRLEEGLRILF